MLGLKLNHVDKKGPLKKWQKSANVNISSTPLDGKIEKEWQHLVSPLQWRHNRRDSVSNHQARECLLGRLVRRRSMKISKLRVTGLCAGNSPETGEFHTQRASYAEKVSIWWRHHFKTIIFQFRHVFLAWYIDEEVGSFHYIRYKLWWRQR